MCGNNSSAPPTPDYQGAAVAQGAANLDAARASAKLSNPNIVSPYGNQTVQYGTGDQQDIPTVTQTLTPTGQQTLDSQQQAQLKLANLGNTGATNAQNVLNTSFTPTGTAANQAQTLGQSPNAQTSIDTSGIAKAPVNAGTTGQEAIMSRLQPQIEQEQKATRQRLANQGLVPGGEAYDNEMRNQNNQENDLRTQAVLQGINLDTTANQQGFNQAQAQAGQNNAGIAQNFNQGLGQAQFNNSAQQNDLQQQLALRQQPLNEISGLLSSSQIQTPQFQGYQGSQVQAAPVFQGAQAAGNAALQNYGIGQSGANAQTSGLYNLAGTAARAYFGG